MTTRSGCGGGDGVLVTALYLVRHAQSESSGPDATRGLSGRGQRDVERVTEVLRAEGVQIVCASPYTRAIQTVAGFAALCGLPIEIDEGFQERNFAGPHVVVGDRLNVMERGFRDPDFSLPGGESNREVTRRGIAAITRILLQYAGKRVAIGTHGGVMTLIMRQYDDRFDVEFLRNLPRPAIFKLTFQDGRYLGAQEMGSLGVNHPGLKAEVRAANL